MAHGQGRRGRSVRGLLVATGTALTLLVPIQLAGASEGAGPTRHSSDGVVGPRLSEAASFRLRASPEPSARVLDRSWDIAPGVSYAEWTQTLPQGAVRLHVLRADLTARGVSLDLVNGRRVTDRAPLSQQLAAAGGAAGVNADFFDISDTGAPLGVGRQRARGLLHGPRTGWNTTFAVGGDGTPRVGAMAVTGQIRRGGRLVARVDGLNDPVLTHHEIGVYNAAWGAAPGRRVTDGARAVRRVVVQGGKVRSTTSRPAAGGAIKGTMLIGRGRGAAMLGRLKVGQRVQVTTRAGRVGDRVAVGGSAVLLRAGAVATTDNRELHPRTAVGYSRDTGEVIMVVADGRSTSSNGLTLLQLAEQLRALGADDAINLDGGGSSTLVAPDAGGVVGVRNQPSDGVERRVPNGLVLRWPAR